MSRIKQFLVQFTVGLLVCIIGAVVYLINEANKYGEFNTLIIKGTETCHKVEGDFSGCEDLVAIRDGTLFGSKDDRYWMQIGSILVSSNVSELKASHNNGEIIVIPSKSKTNRIYPARLMKFPLDKNGDEIQDFHPHGLATAVIDDRDWLFAVNHRRDGEFIEVFEVKKAFNTDDVYLLYYLQSIDCRNNKYFARNINSVTVVSENVRGTEEKNFNNDKVGFYVTNWENMTLGTVENVGELFGHAKTGSVVYCQTDRTSFLNAKQTVSVKNVFVALFLFFFLFIVCLLLFYFVYSYF